MIALTQYLVRFTIVIPILSFSQFNSSLSEINFFLLVLSTVLISAGGYIINDYYDFPIDTINKPSEVIVDGQLDRKWCMKIYVLLSGCGVLIGCYLSFVKEIPNVWMINILSTILLWKYSSDFKKIFLLGNLVISFLTGLAVIILLLTDSYAHGDDVIKKLICGYTVFAFVMTFIREVIKDMEDKEGDETYGRKTLPVVLGVNVSKTIVLFLIVITLSSLVFIQFMQHQWNDMVSFCYVVFGIEIPLLVLAVTLFRAGAKEDFNKASSLTKTIMLTGILSMLVFYLRYK